MKKGDHIFTKRIGYLHHGLYIGNNQVIHYEGSSVEQLFGRVSQTSLSCFAEGAEVYVQDYPFRFYDADESIERATSRLNEELYNLFANNCEHFVIWCIMGIPFSEQVAGAGISVGAFFSKLAANHSSREVLHQTLIRTGMAEATISTVLSNIGSTLARGSTTSSAFAASALRIPMLASAPTILPISVALVVASLVATVASEEIEDLVEHVTDAFDEIGEGLSDVGMWCCDAVVDGLDLVEDVLCDAVDSAGEICESIADFFTGF